MTPVTARSARDLHHGLFCTFGEDEAGNLYLADYAAGRVLQVVPAFRVCLPLAGR